MDKKIAIFLPNLFGGGAEKDLQKLQKRILEYKFGMMRSMYPQLYQMFKSGTTINPTMRQRMESSLGSNYDRWWMHLPGAMARRSTREALSFRG